ncbi:MAG: ADP-L-glycero-D-mannoheptose-6-epimerase, partial [Kiritimatiellae bacterium]|nr:ADP-L-glycero-D-mannoheptose-6-epimerase [Kiritimatiellia bacterium]
KGDMRSVVAKQYALVRDEGRIALFKSDRTDCADGCQDRDFVYVKDAAAVTVWFGDHPDACGIFNCGTGKARTWLDLAHAMFAAAGRAPRIEFVDMPEKLRGKYQYHTQADTTRLRATGCDVPFRPLEDAVRDYVESHLSKKA